jgi:hypothetical protein
MLSLRYGARQAACSFAITCPLLNELIHDFTLVMDIHENQNVGHQMPILDDLALLVARIGCNDALIAECDELNEVVEPLADGGGVIHGPSEFGLSQVFGV